MPDYPYPLEAITENREVLMPSNHVVDEIEASSETTPEDTARILGVSGRTLQRWEKRGLPAVGRGKNKRYLWPHTAWWARAWEIRQTRGDTPTWICMDEAFAWHSQLLADTHFRAAGVQR